MNLSYSRISTLLGCPRKFELRYVEGVRVPAPSPFYLGRRVHEALAENYRHKFRDGEDMKAEEVGERFIELFSEPDEEVDWGESRDYLRDVGVLLIQKYMKSISPNTRPLNVEFKFERDGVTGICDLIDQRGMVVDYKTSARRWGQDEADRKLQPLVYAFGLGGPTNFEFHILTKTKVPAAYIIQTARSMKEISWFSEVLLPRVRRQIEAGIFPPNAESNFCREKSCEYYQICKG